MSPAHPTEKRFEDHITDHLVASGYAQRQPSSYDKALCLIPDDVIAFVQATQLDQWQKLEKQYGTAEETARRLCERLQSQIDRKGTLEILRKGIETRGCKFKLAYFRPSSGMNPDHLAQYQQNRFVVIRQLQYSQKNTNELDLTLFLNGLPLLTAELKNSLTGQFVEQAVKQYKEDRDPKEPPMAPLSLSTKTQPSFAGPLKRAKTLSSPPYRSFLSSPAAPQPRRASGSPSSLTRPIPPRVGSRPST